MLSLNACDTLLHCTLSSFGAQGPCTGSISDSLLLGVGCNAPSSCASWCLAIAVDTSQSSWAGNHLSLLGQKSWFFHYPGAPHQFLLE